MSSYLFEFSILLWLVCQNSFQICDINKVVIIIIIIIKLTDEL